MSYPQQPPPVADVLAAQAAANLTGRAEALAPAPQPSASPPVTTPAAQGPQFSPEDEQLLADLEQRRYAAAQAAIAAARAQAVASAPVLGSVVLYRYHDMYAEPARERDQLVVVTEVTAEGKIRGLVLGFADQAAEFTPGQLAPL